MTHEEIVKVGNDAFRRGYLTKQGAPGRQDAIVSFIIGCTRMAIDLKQLREHQRSYPSARSLDETAALIERQIAEEFRLTFGHPLFQGVKAQESTTAPSNHVEVYHHNTLVYSGPSDAIPEQYREPLRRAEENLGLTRDHPAT